MKRFLIQVVIYVAVVAAIAWIICPPGKLDDNAHLAAIKDKIAMLRSPSDQPRIIFLGGSSVATSNDSKRIAQGIGGYTPVNMGLNAGLGMDYIMNANLANIRKGDLVVLSLEYQLFTDEMREGNYDFIHDVLMYDKSSLNEVTTSQFKNLMDMSIYRYMKQFQDKAEQYRKSRKIKKKDLGGKSRLDKLLEIRGAKMYAADAPYTRDSFDEVGDMQTHLDLPREIADDIIVYKGPIDHASWKKTIDMINEFTDKCREKGADVVFFMTMIPEYNYKKNPTLFDDFAKFFREHSKASLLNRPDESLLTDDHFFDTPYHLLRGGRDIRSSLLLKDLKKYLDEKNQKK